MTELDSNPSSTQIQLNANYYISLVSFVILYYDYVLTFGMEVERFWSSPTLTWGSSFFYANRYLSLFGHVPVILESFWRTSSQDKEEVCQHLQSYHQYFAIAVQLIVAGLLIMRMYALYSRSRWILALFVGTALGAIIFGCWAIISGKHATALGVVPEVGCNQLLTSEEGVRLALAWSGLLVFDVLVFILTMYKSWFLGRTGDRTLLNILLRDGAMYFGIMVASNLANILTFLLGVPRIKGLVTPFTNIISSTMISRLMLNLRDPNLTNSSNKRAIALSTSAGSYPVMSTLLSQYQETTDWLSQTGNRNGLAAIDEQERIEEYNRIAEYNRSSHPTGIELVSTRQ